jgi:hypothetical protein
MMLSASSLCDLVVGEADDAREDVVVVHAERGVARCVQRSTGAKP